MQAINVKNLSKYLLLLTILPMLLLRHHHHHLHSDHHRHRAITLNMVGVAVGVGLLTASATTTTTAAAASAPTTMVKTESEVVSLSGFSTTSAAISAAAAPASNDIGPTTATVVARMPIPPPRVRLNKCCHFGEKLDMMQNCVVGNSELWVPQIYLINRRKFYEQDGRSPKFITFEENVRPVITDPVSPNAISGIAGAVADQRKENVDGNNAVDNDYGDGCLAEELELLTGSGNFIIFSNGSLFVRERGQVIEPRRYCVDLASALVCFPKETGARPRLKLKKCCGSNASIDAATMKCIFPPEQRAHLKLPINESVFQTVYGFPKCQEKTPFAIAGNWEESQLQPDNGHLVIQHKSFSTEEYCLEHLREGNSSSTTLKVFTCWHHFAPADASEPTNGLTSTTDRFQIAALNFGILISVVFLAATLVASYLMPSVHHVLHWRCQIYYVACLLVGDLLLAYTQLSNSLKLGSPTCLILASVMHFFFLSAFFWLNTMCFNIWWTFRDFRPSSLERNQELLRLRLYSAYAWGIPLMISVIAACIDQLPDTQLVQPGFGVRSCWFSGEQISILAYFFIPVGVLLFINIILFVSTTHQLTCGLWKRDDVKSTTEKTALGKVCLKLVVVMGVTWIADIISYLVAGSHGSHSTWFLTDLINALQGVFIFLVVGCQPQVWSACKRYCCPRSRQEITNTTNGVQHSSSSQGLPSMAACGPEITQNTSVNTTTIITSPIQTKIPMETVC